MYAAGIHNLLFIDSTWSILLFSGTLLIIFILGSQLILWGLLTMRLRRFLERSHSSFVACWDWSHRRITRPNHPLCHRRKFSSSCNKVHDFVPLLLIHVAPLKTVHGKVFFAWFGLTDNWDCWRIECGNTEIKDPMVQLKVGPTSRKGLSQRYLCCSRCSQHLPYEV